MRLSVVVGSLFVMLVAPVLASSVEPAVPAAESGALRVLARELQPSAAQATVLPEPSHGRGAPAADSQKGVPAVADAMTVSIDCDDRACVISSGLVVQVVASAPLPGRAVHRGDHAVSR